MASGTAAAWITAIGAVAGAGASMWSSAKQQDAAAKARREQRAAMAKARAEAQAERDRIENLEAERLERLRKRGAHLPPSMLTQGMSGATGTPSTLKPTLG